MPPNQPALIYLRPDDPLPDPSTAWDGSHGVAGLLAAGGGLAVERLREAYSKGCFPWFSAGQPVLWWSPDPRMVLQVAHFRFHRSLRQWMKTQKNWEIRIDTAFDAVIEHCAKAPRPGQNGTWIVADMVSAYKALYAAGFAHSVETWIDGQLCGGLYCVSIGHAVFGESMFSLVPNGSKIALAALVAFCKAHQVSMVDCQQNTPHLALMGGGELPRREFLEHIRVAQTLPPLRWQFEPLYWSELLTLTASL
ncbi:MAG: leucyl/phenylalanyl-tRNA--protein transferase [Betaproteobacteria bacterium]|nr:leucyl/phenylalanyl-tRNA--protein transferase [Betaproteobacteria bacterium]NBY32982.1 leucyl/phenylalanyl-tRNA--protein transferase [Betaproteobacteria bacterium]